MAPSEPSRDGILPFVFLGLTVTTGIVDAVSYLALGHVFTANMTGNIVFLGFALARTPGLSIGRSGAALAAFLAGAVIGGRFAATMSGRPRHRWTATAFGLEAVLLAGAAVTAAVANTPAFSDHAIELYVIIVLTGVAMGVRIGTIRKLAIADLTTTVLTMTLAGLAADSTLAGGSNQGWRRRIASVVTMCAGGALGAWLLRYSVALPLAVGSAISALCAIAAYFETRLTTR